MGGVEFKPAIWEAIAVTGWLSFWLGAAASKPAPLKAQGCGTQIPICAETFDLRSGVRGVARNVEAGFAEAFEDVFDYVGVVKF